MTYLSSLGVYDIPKRKNRIRWHMDGVSLFTATFEGGNSSQNELIHLRKLFHSSEEKSSGDDAQEHVNSKYGDSDEHSQD